MIGTATARARPLKLALIVNPKNIGQVREAIRLACCQWGGAFFPIVPIHTRLPATWREANGFIPKAADVAMGYLDAFDPDLLVQFGRDLPPYLKASRLDVVKPSDFWRERGRSGHMSVDPIYGIGVGDLLAGIFKEYFKFVPKFPLRAVIPAIPKQHGLFWASVYGDYPKHVSDGIDSEFKEALSITRPMASVENFEELTESDVIFPRRVTQWETHLEQNVRSEKKGSIFYMDATKVDDVVEYWNLRATGQFVLPLPKQFRDEKPFRDALAEFIGGAPGFLEVASFVPSRSVGFDEMQAFVASVKIGSKSDRGTGAPRVSIHRGYPQLWESDARGMGSEVQGVYGSEQATFDIDEGEDERFRIKPLLPKFAPENTAHSVSICANEMEFRIFGADRLLAEVVPKAEGIHLSHVISGTSFREWRSGSRGLVKIVSFDFAENRRVLESESVVFAWLQDRGWKATMSSPGILAKQVYKRLGGWTQMLANKKVLNLLEHMNGGNVNRAGILKNPRVAQNRELAVEHLKSELNGRDSNVVLFERLVERGVFKLGLHSDAVPDLSANELVCDVVA